MKIKLIAVVLGIGLAVCVNTASAVESVKIGLIREVSGVNSLAGTYKSNGVALALDEINRAGGVLGRPLEIVTEDNQSTNPGSVNALSQLLKKGNIRAIITTVFSSPVLAMSPEIAKAGIPAMVGGTDYTLTHANNPWIFRARPHDGYSAKVIADYGVNTLKKKKWAIVHSTEAFGIGGKNRLTEALKAFGITPVLIHGINNKTQNLSAMTLALKQSGADIVATYVTFNSDMGKVSIALKESGSNAVLFGSPSANTRETIQIAGDALWDSYSISDFVAESNPIAKNFAKKYKDRWGDEPDHHSSWAYDALHLLALAINTAKSTDPGAIRKKLLAIKGHKGAEGTYTFDQNGDGLHGYNVVKNEHGKIVFIKYVSP